MIGLRAVVRKLSSIRSSSNTCVDAFSIILSGVVKTMLSAVEDDREDDGDNDDVGNRDDVFLVVCDDDDGDDDDDIAV